MTTTSSPAAQAGERTDPYADSPDAGNDAPCNCGGAWHAMRQHCVDWPCPGCDSLCRPEPGTEDDPIGHVLDWTPSGPDAARLVAYTIAGAPDNAHSHLVSNAEIECASGHCNRPAASGALL